MKKMDEPDIPRQIPKKIMIPRRSQGIIITYFPLSAS